MLKLFRSLSVVLLCVGLAAHAVESSNTNKTVINKVREAFGEAPSMVAPAPIPGYSLVVTTQGDFFVSNDGRYMIYGRLFDLKDGLVEITGNGLNSFRKEQLSDLAVDAITYPAKGKEKYNIYVFTDITCGYCRKMHRQIEEYQEAGITVNYLAFPRSPEAGVSMQRIWCAKDNVKALTDAKLKNEITTAQCEGKNDTVQSQHEIGMKFGVRGTPAMVLENGALMPGYRTPKDLVEVLSKTL